LRFKLQPTLWPLAAILTDKTLEVLANREISLDRVKENLVREVKKEHRIGLEEEEKDAEHREAILRARIDRLLAVDQTALFPDPQAERRRKIEAILRVLLEEVHGQVQQMRLDTLWNLWNYTRQPDCKRRYLLGGFGQATAECGFCDSCQPDLAFPRERARTAPEEADNADVVHDFHVLARKKPPSDETDRVLKSIRQRHLETSVIGMAEARLESDPRNVTSRFIAGKLRAERRDRREQADAFRHFVRGYDAADEEYRDPELANPHYS
jgi:hypothetical protein